jgi:hypothetical protein
MPKWEAIFIIQITGEVIVKIIETLKDKGKVVEKKEAAQMSFPTMQTATN